MPIGPVILELTCTELNNNERSLLRHPLVGGVILSPQNYQSGDQIENLIYEIRDTHTAPILIVMHHEDKSIQKLSQEFTELPALSKYGELFDADPEAAVFLAELGGWLMAAESLSIGVDLCLTPSLKVLNKLDKNCFHYDPEVITILAQAFLHGIQRAGMSTIGKDFPGLDCSLDNSSQNDVTVPISENDAKHILDHDIKPFNHLAGTDLSAIMPAHIIYNKLDEMPITYSRFWLTDALREQANFKGAIISHNLLAPGSELLGNLSERAMQALEAGCDMVSISTSLHNGQNNNQYNKKGCQNYSAVLEVLECLNGYAATDYSTLRSSQRLLKLCGHFQHTRHELFSDEEYRYSQGKIHDFIRQ